MNLLHALKQAEETRQTSEATYDMPDILPFPALDFSPLQQAPARQADCRIEPAAASLSEEFAEQEPPRARLATADDIATEAAFASVSLAETLTERQNVRPLLSAPRTRPSHRLTAWLVLAGGILFCSMGAWFWWQWQSLTVPAPPLPVVHAAEKPAIPADKAEETAPAPAFIASAPMPLFPATTPPLKPASASRPPAGDKAAYLEAQPTPANLPDIERNTVEAAIPAPLEAAWRAWQRGDLASAETLYRRMLTSDSRNRDAQLGLAAIAARQGEKSQAAQGYQRVLALNPQDEEAQAGLLLIHPEALSETAEAQLLQQADSNRSPQVLGQYYAVRNRWHEAQEQYFRAFVREPGNADLAFNLAVSLDHINQKKLAVDYYRRALTLGRGSFSPAGVEQRLTELLVEQP